MDSVVDMTDDHDDAIDDRVNCTEDASFEKGGWCHRPFWVAGPIQGTRECKFGHSVGPEQIPFNKMAKKYRFKSDVWSRFLEKAT